MRVAVLRLLGVVAALGAMPVGAAGAPHPVPLGPLPADVEPLAYRLSFEIDPRLGRFQAHAEIDVRLLRASSRMWLHGLNLSVRKACARTIDGKRVAARYREVDESGVALLSFESGLAPGKATLQFDYEATYSDATLTDSGLARIFRAGEWYVSSMMYPVNARMVFPSFDEPRFKTSFELTVTAPADAVVITNAAEKESARLSDGRQRSVFERSEPLPTYLIALFVGPFDLRRAPDIPSTQPRSRSIALRAIAARGRGAALSHALAVTPSLLGELERYVAAPYPYSKLDLVAIPNGSGGGMENAAAIGYGENSLLLGGAASPISRRDVEYTHAHELAHQWFGDLVTPAWWDDAWINEAFATWLALRTLPRWSAGRDYDRVQARWAFAAMDRDSRIDARAIRTPIRRTADIDAGLTPLMYDKGSAIAAMFEHYVGPEAFQQGLRDYLRRFANRPARTDDLLESLDRASRTRPVSTGFRTFLEQPGVPLLAVDWECDQRRLRLRYAQARYVPLVERNSPAGGAKATGRWHFPACFSYGTAGNRSTFCRIIDRVRGELEAPVKSCPQRLMPNADGAGYYRFELPRDHMQSLAEHVDELSASEALALEDSFAAALHGGSIDVETYLRAVPRFASFPAWDVAVAPVSRLRFIAESLVRGEQRTRVLEQWDSIYGPMIRRIEQRAATPESDFTPDEAALVRQALEPFLTLETRDAEMSP